MNITLDRRSKTPLAQQLEIELRTKMIRGELNQGTVLPQPQALAKTIGMTAEQVEQAYLFLQGTNHLIQKSNGWTVNYGRVSKFVFEKFVSLFDIISQSGAVPSIKTLIIKKDQKLTHDLDLDIPFKKVLYAKRIYYGNDKPMVLMDCYFPQELYPDLDKILQSNEPYYSVLKSKFGLEFGHSDRTMEAQNLRKKEAELLEVPVGTTYAYSIVKTYDKLDRLIEVDVCWILPDTMHFTIDQTE